MNHCPEQLGDAHWTMENSSLKLQRKAQDENVSLDFISREVITKTETEVNKIPRQNVASWKRREGDTSKV
jgi:hypothetical protein